MSAAERRGRHHGFELLAQVCPPPEHMLEDGARHERIERAASDALADYSEKELALLLDFVRCARNAAVDAMTAPQAQVEPGKKRRSKKRSRA